MQQAKFSIDGGITWQNINNDIRICYEDVDVDDDLMKDMKLTITHEGVIVDVVNQDTNEIIDTAPLDIEFLLGIASNDVQQHNSYKAVVKINKDDEIDLEVDCTARNETHVKELLMKSYPGCCVIEIKQMNSGK